MVHELTSRFFRRVVTVSDDLTLRIKTHQLILLMADEKVSKMLDKKISKFREARKRVIVCSLR